MIDPLRAVRRTLLPVTATLLLAACEEPPTVEEAIRVVYQPVAQEDVTLYGTYVGQTRASERVEINPRVDGFHLQQHGRERPRRAARLADAQRLAEAHGVHGPLPQQDRAEQPAGLAAALAELGAHDMALE